MNIELQIQSALDRFSQAWDQNDGSAVGGFFTTDGSLVNPFGERADGRDAVSAMYTTYFGGMLAGTTTRIEVGSARAVGDSHAFADSKQVVCAPDGSVILSLHLSALLRREGDAWRFVDARPYTAGPPA